MYQKRKLISVQMVIFALLISACGVSGGGIATPTPLPPIISYEKALFSVERGSIVSEKYAGGEVVPSKQNELYFRASGYVTRIIFKLGDTVKKGELIAEMQVDDLVNQVEQARIDLEVAQAKLIASQTQARYGIQRAETQVKIWEDRVALARMDIERAVGADAQARAKYELDITEQNLTLARIDLQQTSESANPYEEQAVERTLLAVQRLESLVSERQIFAPYDCIILRSMIRPGNNAEAFNVLFVVGDPTTLVIRTQYEYSLREKLRKDMEVNLTFSVEDTETHLVQYLPNFLPITPKEGQTGTAAGEYLYFTAPQDIPQDQLEVGQSVNLTIVLGRKENVLLLPPAAIRNYRGLNFVIVQEGDRKRRVEIFKVGLESPERWEIEADLKEGDQVLGP